MSDFSRFRTAVGGFSRTDVVNYIEETSAAHQKALRKLEDEKQAFADENDHLLAENTRLQAELSDLRAEHEKLKEEDSALSAQVVSLSDEASELGRAAGDGKAGTRATEAGAGRSGRCFRRGLRKRNPPTKIPHSRKQPAPGRSQPAGACRLSPRRAGRTQRHGAGKKASVSS